MTDSDVLDEIYTALEERNSQLVVGGDYVSRNHNSMLDRIFVRKVTASIGHRKARHSP